MMWSFIYPLSPKIVQSFGKGATEIGILGSVGALGNGVAAPFLGALADRIGRKPVLVTSMIGATIASVLTGFAQNYWFLLAARLVTGITGGTASVAAAYITDVTTDEERPSYLTKYQAANFLGLTLGPVLGGVVNELAGWRAACFVSAGLVGINLILLFFLPESRSKQQEAESAARGQPAREVEEPPRGDLAAPATAASCFSCACRGLGWPVWIIATGSCLQMLGFAAFEALGTLYVQEEFFDGDADEATLFVSIALSVFAIAGLTTNIVLYDHIHKCVGLQGSIVLGGLLGFLGVFGIGFPINQWFFMAEVVILAVGENLMLTSVATILTLVVPDHSTGRALGLVSMMQNFASAVGPFAAGAVYEHLHKRVPWFTVAGLKIICIALVYTIKVPKVASPSPAEGDDTGPAPKPEPDSTTLLHALSRQTRHGFLAPGGEGAVLSGHLGGEGGAARSKQETSSAAPTAAAAVGEASRGGSAAHRQEGTEAEAAAAHAG
eukprot:CAMPEP_0115248592 /NCGR_PEP_ID=MMETSP0270-20121206/42148_1 /TAXON_ID=71861 /ORGANISM="Scrippsiella trochoidea, Strain CCMP3099" /LENGTH=495 /DNA_ID=CAMNT_0002663895 /DNA_START=12 /DNA_END=1496 /DNA_ORIENTATION=-